MSNQAKNRRIVTPSPLSPRRGACGISIQAAYIGDAPSRRQLCTEAQVARNRHSVEARHRAMQAGCSSSSFPSRPRLRDACLLRRLGPAAKGFGYLGPIVAAPSRHVPSRPRHERLPHLRRRVGQGRRDGGDFRPPRWTTPIMPGARFPSARTALIGTPLSAFRTHGDSGFFRMKRATPHLHAAPLFPARGRRLRLMPSAARSRQRKQNTFPSTRRLPSVQRFPQPSHTGTVTPRPLSRPRFLAQHPLILRLVSALLEMAIPTRDVKQLVLAVVPFHAPTPAAQPSPRCSHRPVSPGSAPCACFCGSASASRNSAASIMPTSPPASGSQPQRRKYLTAPGCSRSIE